MDQPDRAGFVAGEAGAAAAMAEFLEANPDAVVAAMGPEGLLVPMPDSVPLAGQRVFKGRTAIELVVEQDQIDVIQGWTASQHAPVVRVQARFVTDADAASTIHFFDVRAEHGVHVIALLTSDPDRLLVAAEAVEVGPPGVAHVKRDAGSVFLDVDDATTVILGWPRAELIGRRTLDFIHPGDRDRAVEAWLLMRGGVEDSRSRIRLRHANGHYVWLEVTNENRLDDPDVGCVVSRMVDISPEMAELEALHDRERLLRRLAETLPIGICHLRSDGKVVTTNPPLVALLGPVDSVDALVASVTELDRPAVRRAVDDALRGKPGELEVGVMHEREERRCDLTLRTMTNDSGATDGVVVCTSDVTDRSRLRSELEHRASHDALSGCLNRAATVSGLERALRQHRVVVVAYIDLDRFKAVNDELGHAAGDEVLRVAAARLRNVTRSEDQLGRMGGDEFVLVCPEGSGPVDPDALARRLLEAINGDVTFAAQRIPLQASVGVAVSTGGDTDAEALLSRADAAMYDAKRDARPALRSVDGPSSG